MLVLCLAVFAPLLLAGGNCQVNDDCDLVRVGLEPVLAPCRTSVETCVIEASFATFTDVFAEVRLEISLITFSTVRAVHSLTRSLVPSVEVPVVLALTRPSPSVNRGKGRDAMMTL